MTGTAVARQETLDVTPLKFFTISQNNSYGQFDYFPERGIGHFVTVQAASAKEAEERFEEVLDYPHSAGYCPCCGERWSVWLSEEDGTDVPSVYGEPVRLGEVLSRPYFEFKAGEPEGFVHYLSGRIEGYAFTS